MSSISHIYHLYVDGDWQQCWDEHMKALNMGLVDHISNLYICMIGSKLNIENAKSSIPRNAMIVLQEDSGWEQSSLQWIHDNINSLDDNVLYCHSKGAGFPGPASPAWRRTMTYDIVVNWMECIDALNSYDAVGTWWHQVDSSNGYCGFFAGNFWWATRKFLATLDNPLYRDRYDAEIWIGSNFNIEPKFLRDGHFNPGASDWSELWIYQ